MSGLNKSGLNQHVAKFTDAVVAQAVLKCHPKTGKPTKYELVDGLRKGLRVVIRPNGRRVFILRILAAEGHAKPENRTATSFASTPGLDRSRAPSKPIRTLRISLPRAGTPAGLRTDAPIPRARWPQTSPSTSKIRSPPCVRDRSLTPGRCWRH